MSRPGEPKGVCAVFDMDGTLIHSIEDIAHAVNTMRMSYGFPAVPVQEVIPMVGDGASIMVKRAMAGLDADPQEALRRYRAAYDAALVVKTTLYPHVTETLKKLQSAGVRLAVFTNKPQHSSEVILQTLGCREFFECVIGADSGYPLKPQPDALYAILTELHCNPAVSRMIGDNWTDVEAGHAAGMQTCFCQYGYGKMRQDRADSEIWSFEELETLFLQINK